MRRLAVLAVVSTFMACPSKTVNDADSGAGIAVAIVDSGIGDSGVPDAGPTVLEDGGEIRGVLGFNVAATLLDGGLEVLSETPGHRMEVDPAHSFTITTDPLVDYRIRLLDSADQIVPSDDSAHVTDAGLMYRIDLLQPLKAGRTYSLELDAQTGTAPTDASGRRYDDVELSVHIRGDLESDTPGSKAAGGSEKTKKKH